MIILVSLEMGSLVTCAKVQEDVAIQHYSQKEKPKKETNKKNSVLSSIAQLRKDLKKVR